MALWKRTTAGAPASPPSAPSPSAMPSPDGVAIFGDHPALARVIDARNSAIPMLAAATTQEQRFKALLLLTNMSKRALDQITVLLDRVPGLSVYDRNREAAASWAEAALQVIKDTNRWTAEQKALALTLGDARAQAVLGEVRELVASLLSDPAERSAPPTGLIEEPRSDVPIFGHNEELLTLIRHRNTAYEILTGAGDAESRLVAAYVLNGATTGVVRHMRIGMRQLQGLPKPSEEHEDVMAWLRGLQRAVDAWPQQIRIGQQLAETLGEELNESAKATARKQLEGRPTEAAAPAEEIAAATPDERTCPDCAETIKAAARVCRFCGYRFAERP